jgi:hypothetical protein
MPCSLPLIFSASAPFECAGGKMWIPAMTMQLQRQIHHA